VPGPGQVLVRTLYLSLDPTNRIWMSDMEQYMPPVNLGEVMRGGTLSVVEQSNNDGFAPGDVVNTFTGWQEYAVIDGGQKLPPGLPLPAYMSVLGATGATAYFGLLDLGKPKEGETVVVSAAAGAVGQIVGQIAKIKGCRVVGIAGSDAKCKHLVSDLGFDAAINYKTTRDMRAALKRECPNGIDVDFENAGGEILDADRSLEAPRELGEELVARAVSPGVVDRLETVEVEIEDCRRTRATRELLLHCFEQVEAVRQARERVVVRLVPELLLELRHLCERMLEPAVLEQDARMAGERLEQLDVGVDERADVAEAFSDHEQSEGPILPA